MKILLLDIETAPNLVTVWGLWNQNVSINQIMDAGYVLCWAAKWLDDTDVMYSSIFHHKPKQMLKYIHSLLDEADAVIHYNGSKFDIPTLNKEFILHGLPPPAPYKQIDLLKTARSQFKFPSNKLDYIAQALDLGRKLKHRGHELWIACMNKDPEAWMEMEEYNIQDVLLLEKVYKTLLPWIKHHPNVGLYNKDTALVCPHCGTAKYQKRGFTYTSSYKYQRYQCKNCKAWFRDTNNIGYKPKERFQNV